MRENGRPQAVQWVQVSPAEEKQLVYRHAHSHERCPVKELMNNTNVSLQHTVVSLILAVF